LIKILFNEIKKKRDENDQNVSLLNESTLDDSILNTSLNLNDKTFIKMVEEVNDNDLNNDEKEEEEEEEEENYLIEETILESPEPVENIKIKDHNCPYFKNSDQKECLNKHLNNKNRSKIFQNFCLNCDDNGSNDLLDSLDFMAFMSPQTHNSPINIKTMSSIDPHILSSPTQTSFEPINSSFEDKSTNISQTLDMTVMNQTVPNEIETESSLITSDFDSSNGSSFNTSSFFYSSDTTFVWSGDDEDDDIFLQILNKKEKKFELKRKKALEPEIFHSKDDIKTSSKLKNKIKIDLDNGQWWTPFSMPPLPSEVNSKKHKIPIDDTEPFVNYIKKDGKYSLKLNLQQLKPVFNNADDDSILQSFGLIKESCWFTPAITLPSRRKLKNAIRAKSQKQKDFSSQNSQKFEISPLKNGITLDIIEKLNGEKKSSLKINNLSKKNKNNKRKSVRFSDQFTDLKKEEEDDGLFKYPSTPGAKGHYIPGEILKENNNQKQITSTFQSEITFSLPPSSNSSENNNEITDSILNDTNKMSSFYEYDSILFPKSTKMFINDDNCTSYPASSNSNSCSNDKKENEAQFLAPSPQRIPSSERIHLTLFSMELHADSRGPHLQPDPAFDPISFICYSIDKHGHPENKISNHLIIFDEERRSMSTKRYLDIKNLKIPIPSSKSSAKFQSVEYVFNEKDLFNSFHIFFLYF
jgi:hypothetical protein